MPRILHASTRAQLFAKRTPSLRKRVSLIYYTSRIKFLYIRRAGSHTREKFHCPLNLNGNIGSARDLNIYKRARPLYLVERNGGGKGYLAKSCLARAAQIVGKRAGRSKLAVNGAPVNEYHRKPLPQNFHSFRRFFRQPGEGGREGGRGKRYLPFPAKLGNRPGRIIYRSNCRK